MLTTYCARYLPANNFGQRHKGLVVRLAVVDEAILAVRLPHVVRRIAVPSVVLMAHTLEPVMAVDDLHVVGTACRLNDGVRVEQRCETECVGWWVG